jgi:hypothetical protein
MVHDPEAVSEELDFSLLPDELRDLGPLISRYAESDDVDREELLEQASDGDLRELSKAPEGRWDLINVFLDENVAADPGPAQDVALALDSLSQAAMEAMRRTARSGGSCSRSSPESSEPRSRPSATLRSLEIGS